MTRNFSYGHDIQHRSLKDVHGRHSYKMFVDKDLVKIYYMHTTEYSAAIKNNDLYVPVRKIFALLEKIMLDKPKLK